MFFGLTNFSVFKPGFAGWQESSGPKNRTVENYLNRLYSEERMETRCRIFFDFSIPQLAEASTNVPLTHFVQYSEEMPDRYKQLLQHMANQYDFVELVPVSAGKCDLTINESHVGDKVQPGDTFITYNLDDDDVLAESYFSQLSRYLNPAFAGFRISLARGYSAIWHGGELQDLRHKSVPLHNYGLASVNKCEIDGTLTMPPVAPHDICDQYGPVILDSTHPSFLNIRHIDQDTQSAFDSETALARLLSHSAHLRRASDEAEFRGQFSHPAKALKPAPHADLVERAQKVVDMAEFQMDEPRSAFDLCPTFGWVEAERSQVVVSLVLVDSDGKEVGDVGQIPMTSYSHNPKVKYHYFPRLSGARDERRTRIKLPQGIYCRAIRLHYLGPQGGGFEVEGIEIEWDQLD